METESTGKIKILLVDDEMELVDAVRELMEDRGFQVNYANDGVSALDMIKKDAPDLILLDIVMPNMDGIELLNRLKNDKTTKDIPVIMLTVKDGQHNRDLGLARGAYEYISKPYDSLALIRQVTNVLEKSGKIKRKI